MATQNLLDDTRITEFGLLVEATRRLTRIFEASLRKNHDLTMVEVEAMIRLGRDSIGPKSVSAPTPRKMSGGNMPKATPWNRK